MKKLISLAAALLMLLALAIPAHAAEFRVQVAASAASVRAGETVSFTVSLAGAPKGKAGSMAVSFPDSFELVTGEFLKSGSFMSNFDPVKLKGALAFTAETDFNGAYFKLVLKAKTAAQTGQAVSFEVKLEGAGTATAEQTVKIGCASHSFGAWEKKDSGTHRHTCTVCGEVQSEAHKWNGGEVTRPATCKEAGNKRYTCTVCGQTKDETLSSTSAHSWGGWTETKKAGCEAAGEQKRVCSVCQKAEVRSIPALGHSFSSPTVTRKPTCTEPGEETGVCSRCKKAARSAIPALGHSFGEWTESKAPTCTEPGVRKHTCATCGSEVEEAVAALGHDFENPTVVKEPTISMPGLREGTCRRCGETTQESIPCRAVDAATGIRVDAEEGTFAEGTEFAAEPVSGDDARRETISSALEGKGTDYTAYELSASRNGESVSPKKPLKATFPVPAGYGKAGLLLIGADGRAKELPVTLNADGTLTAELSELGLCVVYQKGAAGMDPAQPTDAEEPEAGFPVWIAVAIGGAVVAGGALVLVLVLKKKKAQ